MKVLLDQNSNFHKYRFFFTNFFSSGMKNKVKKVSCIRLINYWSIHLWSLDYTKINLPDFTKDMNIFHKKLCIILKFQNLRKKVILQNKNWVMILIITQTLTSTACINQHLSYKWCLDDVWTKNFFRPVAHQSFYRKFR